MFTRHFGDLLLASTTDGPTYNLDKAVGGVVAAKNLPHLTAVASLSQDRSKLYILAVNRHFTSPIRTKIQLNGFQPAARGTLRTLTAPSLDANNGPDLPDIGGIKWPKPAKAPHNSMFDAGKPGTVTIQTSTIDNAASSFELVIPSKAVVALELDAAAGISALRAPGRKR
jgi:alpha-L-arabinofuranosidase